MTLPQNLNYPGYKLSIKKYRMQMEVKRLLIIGGTGYIGRSLIVRLRSYYSITSISLNPPLDKLDRVDYIIADIANFQSVERALFGKEFEYAINCGGYVNHKKFTDGGDQVIASHLVGTINILRCLNKNKLLKYIQLGSSDEYGNNSAPQLEAMKDDPFSCYSLSKSLVSQLLKTLYKTDNLPVTILRLFLVYGPGQNFNRLIPQIIDGCLKNVEFPTSEGLQIRDLCYIDDIIEGIVLALNNRESDGMIINLASGVPVRIFDVIEKIKTIIGKGNPIYGVYPYRQNENMELWADISNAKKILKWAPRYDLETGIMRTIDYYKKNQ